MRNCYVTIPRHPERYYTEVRLEGAHLVTDYLEWGGEDEWEQELSDRDPPSEKPGAALEFARLVDAPPETVRAFAAHHGLLGLCSCGHPHQHSPNCTPTYREALRDWEVWAERVSAIFRICSALDAGRPPRARDWSLTGVGLEDLVGGDPEHGWRTLGEVISGMLDYSGVRAIYDFLPVGRDVHVEFDLSSGWLFGEIAVDLAALVARVHRPYACFGCGWVDIRPPGQRRPKPGQRSWCASCRARHLPERQAKRDWDERQRRQRGELE